MNKITKLKLLLLLLLLLLLADLFTCTYASVKQNAYLKRYRVMYCSLCIKVVQAKRDENMTVCKQSR